MDISVIICTYNRAKLLDELLRSLAHSAPRDGLDWELIVVDNNSRDETAQVVQAHEDRLPLRYAFEQRQGKTYALNRALEMAVGPLLVFADDDVIVTENWLGAFAAAAAEQSACAWFGGRVKPNWKGDIPGWYREETAPALSGYFGDYDLGESSRPYRDGDKLPLGASLAVRREVFESIGVFREDLGPRGKLRGVGDETELLGRAKRNRFRGYYVAEAKVLHHVGPERRTLSGFWNYGLGKGLNQYRMGEDPRPGSALTAGRYLLRGLLQSAKGRGDRARLCVINAGLEMGRLRGARD